MASILGLPNEVLDLIFDYLVTEELAYNLSAKRNDRMRCSRSVAIVLRQVCRKWADWFYVNHLYDALIFGGKTAYRKSGLITHLTERPVSLIRPRCTFLYILHMKPPSKFYELRRKPTQDKPGHRSNSSWEILESLVEQFPHSLTEIELIFMDFVSLPNRTIGAMGRIQDLRVLRVGLHFTCGNFFTRVANDCGPPESRPDTQCLQSLILAAPNLKRLDLSNLHPTVISSSIGSGLCGHQLPAITRLDIGLDWECSLDGFQSIAVAFKHSLKVLTLYGSCRDRGRRVKPILEVLRETLEGLSMSTDGPLHQLTNPNFPKLRVVAIDWVSTSIPDLLAREIFKYAPIEVFAIKSGHAGCEPKPPPNADMFANMPKLRRLVFFDCDRYDYERLPKKFYRSACEAHGIEWMRLGPYQDISDMMVS
ncbi:hypothetical protein Pst134EA_013263 [Puccinia striiformis f. sp. tritici]|uniref:hypothetical protein n=1 Tax=Puccinia striiformis f. sp. tritici TaxID=168172 RepID=UPI002007B3A1|nr:hypothetical protein Pst134EA_013263 [Puccinia striiformis f. sp. tritici]KAH9465377.1 hypothetical protein Pst134EA_013263 [Puccinia striiformis f. sp. tritici]